MSNDPKWKSDKKCFECKIEHRKEIIEEIKETCGRCPKLKKVEIPKHMRKLSD